MIAAVVPGVVAVLVVSQSSYPSLQKLRSLDLVYREARTEWRPMVVTLKDRAGKTYKVMGIPTTSRQVTDIVRTSDWRRYKILHPPVRRQNARRRQSIELQVMHCDLAQPTGYITLVARPTQ